ncbi:MAG: ParB/RepB/Spo0J family partition protein [Nevskiales bacterium]
MAAKKRGLGRGLDALLSGAAEPATPAEKEHLRHLAVGELHPGKYQPRTDIAPEALESLAQSIRAQGIVQPLVVRKRSEGGYEIIAGERRWRAAQLAGLDQVPVILRDVPDEVAMAVALIENIQRENLNPLDEAHALRRLIDDCGMTHQACADSVGRSRAAVSNLLRLMELEDSVQLLVREGKLEMGHARALLGASGDLQIRIAQRVAALDLSVRQTEAMVRTAQQGGGAKQAKPEPNPRITGLEAEFRKVLGQAVRIEQAGRGKGKLVLKFDNLADLDKLLNRLQ